MAQDKKILLTTVYKRKKVYNYFLTNCRRRVFTFSLPRVLSFGLRFIKQNIPEIEILEYPTWKEYTEKLKEGWDIVGFSFYLNETQEIIEMVNYARNAGIKELWAGNYGALTGGIERYFDKIFIGYGEKEIQKILGRKNTRLIHPPLISYMGTPYGIKIVAFGNLFTSRGCNIGCTFCQTPVFCKRPCKIPIESINSVLMYYKKQGIEDIIILDENFGLFAKHSDEVIDLLYKYRFNWYCMTHTSQLSRSIDHWLKKGFSGAFVGIESMNQEVLDALGKRETIEDTINTVKEMHRANRFIIGFCMIGYEDDTVTSIKNDIKRIAQLRLDVTQLDVLTPFPKTPLWYEIEEKYGIFDKNWKHYDAKHLVWNHPNISPKEMNHVLDYAFTAVYPRTRPFKTTLKWARMYSQREKNKGKLLGGWRYMFKHAIHANRFDYLPKGNCML